MTYVADQTLISTLRAVTCCKCGVIFGIEAIHHDRLKEKHDTFYCPNGHPQGYYGKSEIEKERDRLASQLSRTEQSLGYAREDAALQRNRAQKAERSVSARKAVITRMKRRVKKGRCVCCSHEFKDLARHMKNVHPKFEPEKHVAALEGRK